MVDVHPLISKRESRRAVSSKTVSQDIVNSLLEAFRWAPSSFNRQPWRIVVVRDTQSLARLHEGLTPGNVWAKKAPVMLVVAGNPAEQDTRDGLPLFLLDCGFAIENLLLQAAHLGLVNHPMAGWDERKVKDAIKIPDPFRVVALIAIGYPGELDDLDEATKAKELRPKTRKSFNEFVFVDSWGNPYTQ